MESLQISRVPLDAIVPDPANPRLHDERNVEAIKAGLGRVRQANVARSPLCGITGLELVRDMLFYEPSTAMPLSRSTMSCIR